MPKWRASSWRAFEPSAATARSAGATWRVLGLDPGSRRTGFGVIECSGARAVHLAHGCVSCAEESLSERLRVIFEAVGRVIAEHRPDEIAVERVFVNRNVDSALKLGQARGAALCAIPQGTPVFEYAPRAIKLAVVGVGGADKQQVAHMIGALLGIAGALPHDATDALAVALCHAHSRRVPLPVAPALRRAALRSTEGSSG
ncbi:MAG TPA: crossover junction endodeoxyribonuclease RuvC [Steroidobacteraceae bacterium]|nr:crossover junction endodeoxyribonuclease RuvC [Steroidobacteraceae bacterium]